MPATGLAYHERFVLSFLSPTQNPEDPMFFGWLLVAECWLLVAECWLLIADCWPLWTRHTSPPLCPLYLPDCLTV